MCAANDITTSRIVRHTVNWPYRVHPHADHKKDPLTSTLECLERRLQDQLGITPSDIEMIEPCVISPWWQTPGRRP